MRSIPSRPSISRTANSRSPTEEWCYFPNVDALGKRIAVRIAAPPSAIVPEIRRRVTAVDSTIPLTNVSTLYARIHKTLDTPRFYTIMAGACALMALLFVTLGLYGVISYAVSRTHFRDRHSDGARRA